jgi:hypothetical protein
LIDASAPPTWASSTASSTSTDSTLKRIVAPTGILGRAQFGACADGFGQAEFVVHREAPSGAGDCQREL